MKIFIINAAQEFGHSGGKFNDLLTDTDHQFFAQKQGFEVRVTNLAQGYQLEQEVQNFIWADIIIYHTPVWWMNVPFDFKKYIDTVFTAGRGSIYKSDGRHSATPKQGYGTGGLLQGRKYMLTTTWNAPFEAFTLPGEFFQERGVDDGVMFSFHRMNAFVGLSPLDSIHFYDLTKNPEIEQNIQQYKTHLLNIFK